MALPEFNMRQLLECGVHFGHHTRRWNPQMRKYIFGVRGGVHIIDLQQTVPQLNEALKALREIVAKGGRVLFVGTKRQAREKIAEAAQRCGQYYVNHRWLGGMLTNWKTISKTIARLRELDDILGNPEKLNARTKKEILMLNRERDKLQLSIGGIVDMGGTPDAVFIIDTIREDIAVKEANKLGVPVFAVVDSNASPEGVDYIIPGNDDSIRAIDLYCDLFADTVLDGLRAELGSSKKDPGEAEAPVEKLPAEKVKKASKKEEKADEETAEAPKEDAKVEPKAEEAEEDTKAKKAASA